MGATATQAEPELTLMGIATRLVTNERKLDGLEAQVEDVKKDIATDKAILLDAMENEKFQLSSRVDGATVHHWTQIWAGPVDVDVDGVKVKNHAALTAALEAAGLEEYMPSKVSTQSLSAYVREEIKKIALLDDDGQLRTLQQRAELALPAELVAVLNVTEKREVRVNGA